MTSHGGRRKGAGRKARPDEVKLPLAIKVNRELSAYLATVASKTGTIEDALRRSKGFRDWKRRQSG